MFKRVLIFSLAMFLLAGVSVSYALDEVVECQPPEKQKVKIEGFISKKFKKERKRIFKEFAEIGHARTALRVFPMGNTAKVIAIGRCVPAYIARHVLQKALLYTGGVANLVHQAFYAPHWIGVGVTMFDEPSQQMVNDEQVKQLMDPSLSDQEFHALYRKFSIQDKTVPHFGLQRPNVKIAK